jgi:hypothetical protein
VISFFQVLAMPRRNKSKRARGGRRQGLSTGNVGEVVYSGSRLYNPSATAGSNLITLNPGSFDSTNLNNLADTFGNYRFERLRIRLYPPTGNVSAAEQVVQYYNNVSDVPATQISGAMYLPNTVFVSSTMTVPQTMKIPRKFLLGENTLNFWRTHASSASPTTSDAWDNVQGAINLIVNTACTAYVRVWYTVRFANALTAAMTPEDQLLRRSRTCRRSCVRPEWEKYPILDMYLPGEFVPYPPGRDLEMDWRRVSKLRPVITASSELSRLNLLTSVPSPRSSSKNDLK